MAKKQNTRPSRKPNSPQGQRPSKPLPGYKKGPFSWLLIISIAFTILLISNYFQGVPEIQWDQFIGHVKSGHIESVVINDMEVKGKFNPAGIESLPEGSKDSFKVFYKPDVSGERLGELLEEYNVPNRTAPPRTWLITVLNLLPFVFLVAIFYFVFLRNMRGGAGGMLMSFGRSKHKLHGKDKVKVTFNDVAGIEEAKDEVAEVIEFLKNPKKFQRLGGRIPRGVLLVGPPGCGKTLLAKAIAGEADVPFFSISGSDFVEMFVGVGASRVRDLFTQAKTNSPCIIFLDEVDAIGRKRGAGFAGGGHDEREQTLNAILVEMDGFDTNDQVIVVAATNRGDILDHALTRPGRFDRQVVVPLPDLGGRLEILKVHAKKVKMAPDANLEKLARGTPMFSGADLAAIINEAALAATMANKDSVETADLEEARDKVRWGRARTSRVIDQHEKKITAYHEAGHTIVQAMLKDADPLHKVSIIPRGPMGGATFALPERDRTIFTKRYCMALLQVCFGGRIAEELFCNDISSGAQSDINQATKIARQMVLTWGMSETLGPISYSSDQGFDERMYAYPGEKDYSDSTAQLIDKEIRLICDKAYSLAKDLIKSNSKILEGIAQALLKYETLSSDDVELIIDGGEITKPTVADLLEVEQQKNNNSKPKAVKPKTVQEDTESKETE